jgi:hypothetical protein
MNGENVRSRMETSSAGKCEYRGRKASQVLGTFGLLDFNMLRPVLAFTRFEIYELFISFLCQEIVPFSENGQMGFGTHQAFYLVGTRILFGD